MKRRAEEKKWRPNKKAIKAIIMKMILMTKMTKASKPKSK